MALLVEGGEKRATTAVPGELDAPTCNHRIRRGGSLTVPRGPGLLAKLRCREMTRKATAALATMGLTASEAVRLLSYRIAVELPIPAMATTDSAKPIADCGR